MTVISETDTSRTLQNIVAALKTGKTIVYPTETCYGLGCDAMNLDAVARIFYIKGRQKDKPVLVLMADEAMAMKYVVWDKHLERIAARYWPGPLTVVAPVNPSVSFPNGILESGQMLAFRITEYPLARDLCKALDRPLVSTSANIASLESPYDIESVLAMFQNKPVQPDIIISAGSLPHHSPSTIIRLENGKVEVLRQGEIVFYL